MPARIETLEFRRLFAVGSIAGTVYRDTDGDGIQNNGEAGYQNKTVYIDANNNGTKDSGEVSQVTPADGSYLFDNLNPGTYHIRAVIPGGFEQTQPANNDDYTIFLVSGQDVVSNDFGLRPIPGQTGSISGTVIDDADANAVADVGELGIAGRSVWLDDNNDGILDPTELSTTTDANGDYSFIELPFKTYHISEEIPTGSRQTSPRPALSITATINSGAPDLNTGDFLITTRSDLSYMGGVVFLDKDRDGTQDAGENGIANITVFIDVDNDGTLNAGDISRVTDASGNYFFSGLTPGDFVVRQVLQTNYVQTSPLNNAPQLVTLAADEENDGVDFGTNVTPASIAGNIFDDPNANGVKDVGEKFLAGWTVFIDKDKDGVLDAGETSLVTNANGAFKFSLLEPGTYRIRQVVKAGYRSTTAIFFDVTVVAGQDATGTLFGDTNRGNVSGSVFNDKNTNRLRDSGEVGIKNFKVYIDANNNGRLDASETYVVTNASGNFTLKNVLTGAYKIRVVAQSKYKLTTPLTGYLTATVANAGTAAGLLFGMKLV